jgi:hypothetical protein
METKKQINYAGKRLNVNVMFNQINTRAVATIKESNGPIMWGSLEIGNIKEFHTFFMTRKPDGTLSDELTVNKNERWVTGVNTEKMLGTESEVKALFDSLVSQRTKDQNLQKYKADQAERIRLRNIEYTSKNNKLLTMQAKIDLKICDMINGKDPEEFVDNSEMQKLVTDWYVLERLKMNLIK